MSCFTEEQLNRISRLIREIEKLSDAEKLFLYLQLPCGRAEGKAKYNGTRSDLFAKKPDQETTQTYTWILSHLEIDPSVSLPKQEVYDEYRLFCQTNRFEPLCVADFGKAMKYAFPCIKPRRLGQRGNSRYCYSGLRKKHKIQPPTVPEMIEPTFCIENDCSQAYNQIIRDCHDNPNECPLNRRPNFGTCEVMNLKIDQSQQGSHNNSNIYNTSNGNGVLSYNVGGHLGGKQQAYNSQLLQNIYTIQRPISLNDGTSSSSNIDMVPQQQGARVSIDQYGVPTSLAQQPPPPPLPLPLPPSTTAASVPVTQANHHSRHDHCNYPSIIQQPGTPDDDDYRHNYQDITSVNQHLFDTAATNCPNIITTTTSGSGAHIPTVHTHQSIAQRSKMITTPSSRNDNNGYIYQQTTVASGAGDKISHRCAQNGNLLDNRPQQHHRPLQHLLSNKNTNNSTSNNDHQVNAENNELTNQNNEHDHGPYIENPLNNNPQENNNMLNLSQMSGSYIDSCASPFQSPTSTPYPLIGSYLSHDIQGYYSDDCPQYSNTR